MTGLIHPIITVLRSTRPTCLASQRMCLAQLGYNPWSTSACLAGSIVNFLWGLAGFRHQAVRAGGRGEGGIPFAEDPIGVRRNPFPKTAHQKSANSLAEVSGTPKPGKKYPKMGKFLSRMIPFVSKNRGLYTDSFLSGRRTNDLSLLRPHPRVGSEITMSEVP